MKIFHIHIKGIVQGVGFRPFVYQLAIAKKLNGWVNNTNDGVHIQVNAEKKEAYSFLQSILDHLPPLARVTSYTINEVASKTYSDFSIIQSDSKTKPNLLVISDVAMCPDCKKELHDNTNRRFHYPFITCTNCGPRYSIIKELPYDRPNTSMRDFRMCTTCQKEYDNPLERRHFSQTNSCPDCRIEMQLFENGEYFDDFTDLDYLVSQWKIGKIIAIKGIGGYLLTCDATNKEAILELRKRKQRPAKPFALMYSSIEEIQKDVVLTNKERNELNDISAPIVLLEVHKNTKSGIALEEINSGLSRLGVMLPYTPLYDLLLAKFKKPIVATSGNITDATIVYTDKKALSHLSKIADCVLLNNRKIIIPQDDGVIQFSKKHLQKITLRRSRGKAPTYINQDLKLSPETFFAAGSMLKSTFGLQNTRNTYISQYLGNTASYEAQSNYECTFNHFNSMFNLEIDKVIVDKHPDYFATRFGKALAYKEGVQVLELQHHKAHFYSVLGENNLVESVDPIMGVIWDGTGLGDDGNIWGGEFFRYNNKTLTRIHHIGEFNFIVADKMVKEPRIAALAIAYSIEGMALFLKEKFSDTEFRIYKKLLQQTKLKSTSMGRLFDAVSSILLNLDKHRFEAEASIRLEQFASNYYYTNPCSLKDSYFYLQQLPDNVSIFLIKNIFKDLNNTKNKAYIATRFHISLVDYIIRIAKHNNINKIAFSGGVFQNTLLVDMLYDFMNMDFQLYFQKEFSPNDEGIPFGQLVYANTL